MELIKMHASGDDFILIRHQIGIDYEDLSKKVCNRRLGIGALGLIVVKENPLEMLVFDSDGKRVLASGNALRCFSKYVVDNGISSGRTLNILTGSGYVEVEVTQEIPFMSRINLGKANYNNSMLYINDDLPSFGRIIRVDGMEINTYSLNLGGVHTLIFVDSFDSEYLAYADGICNNPLFKRKTNATFVVVDNKLNLSIKTYEPGIGFTSCNTAACAAAVVAANKLNLCKGKCHVNVEMDSLYVELDKKGNTYVSSGATMVFKALYNEEEE